jgi:SAM-dependent methyltransferase
MKFSELVDFKNDLEKINLDDLQSTVNQELAKITHLVDTAPSQIDNFSKDLNHTAVLADQLFNQFKQQISDLTNSVKDLISQEENIWLQKSYKFYETTLYNRDAQRPEVVTWNRNKNQMTTDEETLTLLHARLCRYSDWRHPAIIIHPGVETFIQDLVSNDPLYLVDESYYLLDPVIEKYHTVYQRRLRPYVIEESFDNEILDKIPNEQFSVCFVYNYLNFRPLEIIKKYLAEIYQKLLPGGTLILTFNDCDRSSAVELVEKNYGSYMPGYLLVELAKNIGYEVEFQWTNGGPSTWLELKRPGKLSTLKGGQTLAKILPKSVAKSK